MSKTHANTLPVSFAYVSKGCYDVLVTGFSGTVITTGGLLMGEDGFWSYWIDNKRIGGLPDWYLEAIVAKLRELNESVEKALDDYFSNISGMHNETAKAY